MNKSELIEVVTQKLGDRKAASEAVEAVVDAITRAVAKGEKVGITGFGVFEKVERAARTARNPTTGAAVKLKKTSVPKFRPGKGFKDIVSGAKKVPSSLSARAVTARVGSSRSGTAAKPAKSVTKPAKVAKAPAVKATAKAVAKPAAKPASKVAAKTPAKAPAKAPTKVAAKATTKAPAKVAAKPAAKPASKVAAKPAAKPASKVAAKPAAKKAPAKKAPAKRAARP